MSNKRGSQPLLATSPPVSADTSPEPSRRPASSRSFREVRDAVRESRHLARIAHDGEAATVGVLLLSLSVGLLFGLVLPRDIGGPWGRVSAALGWASTGCWMIGWYPQLATSFVTRSVAGQSLDYILFNLLGFLCYTAYNVALYASPVVRAEYKKAHAGVAPDVRSNDVFFACHALLCTLLGGAQAVRYARNGQTVSKPALAAVGVAAAGVAAYGGVWAAGACGKSALGIIYALGYVKVGTSAVKYIPQLYHNAQRKSTIGFNVANAATDAVGGALSLAQQALDAFIFRDASLLIGNPAKLALAALSLAYDAGLMVQHYCLYTERGEAAAGYESLGGGPVASV